MPHPATPESFAHYRAMQESTHYLPINQMEDGCAYLIHARNSYIGIWRASDNAFVILREKLGRLFLFPEFHWDTGEPFGTAKPFLKISGQVGHTREALDELHGRVSYADYMVATRGPRDQRYGMAKKKKKPAKPKPKKPAKPKPQPKPQPAQPAQERKIIRRPNRLPKGMTRVKLITLSAADTA